MSSQHFTEENQHHMSRPTNVLQLSNWMISRRTHYEPHWLQLNGTPIHMYSRWSNQIWVEHTKYQYRLNKIDAQPLYASSTIFSLEDQMFIKITALHLYVKSNSSPLREVQINFRCQFSRTQIHHIASYRLHHQMWLCMCGCLLPCPRNQVIRSSFKRAPPNSSNWKQIFSSEPN